MKNYKKKYREYTTKELLSEVREPDGKNPMRNCLYCYKPLHESNTDFHQACNKRFFGQLYTPTLDYKFNDLEQLAQKVVQSHMAVTGVQPKLSLSLHRKKDKNPVKKLTIVGLYGDYILKPPTKHYAELPEVEDLTMHLADVCGIAAVPHSLVKLTDGTRCYLTKRIDRTRQGKLHMEDMCQLTERLTEDKYKGSHEQVAKTVLKYSSNPAFDVTNFWEQVLLSYFTGNADMHLKNFSLLANEQGAYSLAPAYDLVNTALVNPNDTEELALTLNGKKSNLKYADFVKAFDTLKMPVKVLDNMLHNFYYCRKEMAAMVQQSFLREEMKLGYLEVLQKRFELVPDSVK
jgi:serine/threonine-protein kinase HipA